VGDCRGLVIAVVAACDWRLVRPAPEQYTKGGMDQRLAPGSAVALGRCRVGPTCVTSSCLNCSFLPAITSLRGDGDPGIAHRGEGGRRRDTGADTVRGLCSGKGFLFANRGGVRAVRVYEVNWRG